MRYCSIFSQANAEINARFTFNSTQPFCPSIEGMSVLDYSHMEIT